MSELDQFSTQDLLAELQRREATKASGNTGGMQTCSTCGTTLWPNQTHVCPTTITPYYEGTGR